jgi:hypothetical protein
MKFPEHLDHEDMRLAMKEWRLAGCYVEKNRGGLKGHWPQDTDVVYQVRLLRRQGLGALVQPMGRPMIFPDYLDEEDMALFKKELRLIGYDAHESHPRWKAMGYNHYLNVYERAAGRDDVNVVAKYVLKDDGWKKL